MMKTGRQQLEVDLAKGQNLSATAGTSSPPGGQSAGDDPEALNLMASLLAEVDGDDGEGASEK